MLSRCFHFWVFEIFVSSLFLLVVFAFGELDIQRFTIRKQILKKQNMIFGKKIRELRDEQGVLQRQLAALLEIDTPMFSKIERGDRRAKRKHLIKLAEYLHQDEKEMLMLWLADKVLDAVGDDEFRNDAIKVAQEQIQKL